MPVPNVLGAVGTVADPDSAGGELVDLATETVGTLQESKQSPAARIDETGDPVTLSIGAIADGQILSRSGGSIVGTAAVTGDIRLNVRNETGSPIADNTLVAVTGYSVAEDRLLISVADKDSPGLRPAVGVTDAAIADSTNGSILVVGTLTNIDTSSFSANDQLALGDSGAFVRPPPETDPFTGEVQLVGSVGRVDASNGTIIITTAGSGLLPLRLPSDSVYEVYDVEWQDQDGTPVAERRLRNIDGLLRATDTSNVEGQYISAGSIEQGAGSGLDADTLDGSEASAFAAVTHAATHQHGGADEIATATPGANAIPKAGAGGDLDVGWIPDATTTTKGVVELATDGESAASVVVQGNDARLSDARTPTAHASTHQHGGSDEVATATPGANAIPKAGAGGTLADGWVAESNVTQHEAALTITESQISDLDHNDADAIHDNVSGEIALVASKATPTVSDLLLIEDAAATNAKKRITIGSLPAAAPAAHAASHENGGSDEISVAGLSGELADPQPPKTHAASHQHGGADEIATATPGANAIPKAGAGGDLDVGWIPDATTTTKGVVELATDGEAAANVVVQGNDARLSDARTPTAHASSHQQGGSDEIDWPSTLSVSSQLLISEGGTISPDNVKIISGDDITLSATTAISDGTTDGEIMFLSVTGSGSVTIPDGANTDFHEDIKLKEENGGVFIWRSAASKWQCVALFSHSRGGGGTGTLVDFESGLSFGVSNKGLLNKEGTIDLVELADGGNPGAGRGRLWVADTSPTTLVFTDDTDADVTLKALSHLGAWNANDAIFPASNPAAATSRNGHALLAYDDTTAESVILSDVLSNDYLGGSATVDIDWVAASATTGDVVWGVEVERVAPGGQDIDSDGFAAQQTGTSTTNATSGVVTRTSITLTQAQADAWAAGDAFRLRLQRVAGDAGDTMTGDAQVLRVGLRQ